MIGRERLAVALVAVPGVGALLLPALSPLLPAVRGVAAVAADWAVPLVACSAILLLAVLHGHKTGCPACGKWWSRAEVGRGLVDGEKSDHGATPSGRSLERTTYRCAGCGHSWSVTDAEAYRQPGRRRPHRQGG
jgi:hypothetical protein